MACRYPGGVDSPEGLWQLVAEGRDGISEFPADRGWDIERLYDPDPDNPGTSYTREGGFLATPGDFDAEFFGIAPREALAMDPQQRLLLESSWEALEDAGIDPASLRGEPVGVFAGLIHQGYATGAAASARGVEGYQATGDTSSIASGRISYTLGLEGPAITLDTACSSSLVAMHLASHALRQGECTLALAGGVTALANPSVFTEFSRQRGLAPDGRSKSFAEAADGVAWAEGVGVLVLERLSDAQRNGHPVAAVLRGSAVNQDGASNGLTAPNGPSQERVIRQALANARLAPQDVDVVEAHGTGTTLGDPIEAGALLATYGQDREQPLKLGSIKSNIGHTQAAAGVAGVIKMALAMREGVLPKTLHVDAPTSHVDWGAGEVELLTEQTSWEAGERLRRAGVSSFGISGTNAHVILEEAPPAKPASVEAGERGSGGEAPAAHPLQGPIPLPLSAKAEPALPEMAERLAAHLEDSPDLDPTDVAYSLATTRTAFEHRAVILGENREELLASLASLANGDPSPSVLSARARDGKLAYLFTGQGSQRLGMGKELYESDPHFRAAFDAACEQLDQHLEAPLKEIVFAKGKKAAAKLEDTAYAQPALFAIEVALYEALAKRGLKPDLLAGHSIGEIAAAHLAGVLDLADAAKLVAARGKLMGALPAGGAMAAIEATEEEVAESIEGREQELSIAAINGPTSTVISGAEEAVEEIRGQWEERGRKTKRLAVSHAFHSPLIEPMLEEFAEVAKTLTYSEPRIPIVSNVTGETLSPEQATDPAYWVRHVRQPVRFADAVSALKEQGASTYLELGPDPVLCAMAREALGDAAAAFVPTLREGRPEADAISTAIGGAHAAGAKLDWAALFAGSGAKRVPLPTYPFQRTRYWLSSAAGVADASAIGLTAAEHPLLGAAVELADGEGTSLLLTGRLSLAAHPWLADHAVGGVALLPATAFLELALRAAEQVEAPSVEELTLQAPLVLPETGGVAIQVSVSGPDEHGSRAIAIHSRPAEADEEGLAEAAAWTCHATGALSETTAQASESLDAWPPEGAEPIEVDDLYDRLTGHGLEYGPAFQGLTAAWRDGERVYAEVSLPEEQAQEAARFRIHPALLDAALHGVGLAASQESAELKLPFAWSGVSLQAEGARELRARIAPGADGSVSLVLADGAGAPLATVDALAMRSLDPSQLRASSRDAWGLLGVEWVNVSLEEQEAAPPGVELLRCEVEDGAGDADAARKAAQSALDAVQGWLADESKAESRLALITEGAMATSESESPAPAAAAIWGLIRSAQSEHPGRFALIDVDGSEASSEALPAALAIGTEEPQLALREGAALAPRAMPARDTEDSLIPPPGPWHLDALERGTLESLALVPSAQEPLGPTEVRIQMRAAGLNFRDVLVALGLYPGRAAIGGEGAGVVVEAGAEVGDLAPGDRVVGLMSEAFGPLATSERDLLVPIPEGWSFEQAAAMPIVFATAYYGLFDLAGLKAGEKVLVHAGAGGVGMAAIQLARHIGAEVFATASPSKWEVLREAGLDEDHIASSRDLEFKDKFLRATGGDGVDVVLNALAGEFVDTSLDLLPRGGRFLEMGKTDMRDPERVAADRPGVSYLPFDVTEAGPRRTGEILAAVTELFEQGVLHHSPITAWDMRNAPQAFRHLREGRNVGKVVLGIPRAIDPERTVLITGATGGLGALVARHLVERHDARHLLLVSRSGPEADGAEELQTDLEQLGAEATIAACDVSDRKALKKLLASIHSEHPLGAVIHCAGVLADGTVESLGEEQVERVFAPKADAAWHLHELTADLDLSAFVLFSSAAGTFGGPGQANYAAANVYLDALAQKRQTEGLAGTSIAWGLWEREGGMGGELGEADLARMRRGGVELLGDERGLVLFDAAIAADRSQALAAPIETAALRAQASAGTLPPILSGLVRVPRRRGAAAGSLAKKLATLPEADHGSFVLDLVRGEVAAVLGHSSAQEIEPERAFKEMGFDSLAAVELRNRLNSATGLGLGATTVFDYPTSQRLAERLLSEATVGGGAKRVAVRAQASEEPIAIVGMACRYPGGVGSPAELWELVAEGRDGISEFPADRGWDLDRLYNPDPDRPGASYTREGGFVVDAAEFDAEFFGIAPREALAMDPQQRLLLESSWEALEDAGIDPATLRGEPAGVFAGLIHQGYAAGPGASAREVEGYQATGNTASVASGRVAYTLGLEGPAMTVDTACSSSLVAMHLASQALRQGECTLALAGGVTALATPGMFVEFSRQRGLAPDGRSKSFAEAADGVAWAEGVGMLVLERLSDAQRNGHRIFATIKGSAVNQDGASNGLTAPNGPSQERVIRQALANARLEPKDVDAVEAHGTGTTLGDPIEAGALLATYGQDRDEPLKLGSIKSNIGHTQAAAGVAGVIKMALAMRAGVLPKTLHVDAPSSKVDWEAGEIELLTERVEWERNGRPRRAGISSFGISGTNAHVILEEAPEAAPVAAETGEDGGEGTAQPLPTPIPLTLSAKAEPALADAAERLVTHLEQNPDLDPADVAYSLATTRSAFEHRAVVLGADRDRLLASLTSLAEGKNTPSVAKGSARGQHQPVFLFPGQGAQAQGMALELIESSPAFASHMQACEEALAPHVEWSLTEVLREEEPKWLDRLDIVQPALFAVMVSLAKLWRECGVEPAAVVGHSQGEIAAAHIAGALSLEDAALIIAERGKAMAKIAGEGGMLSVSLSPEQLTPYTEPLGERVSLAAINGPASLVLSGDPEALDEIQASCESDGVRAQRIAVDYAAHSSQIEALEEELLSAFAPISPRSAEIPLHSTVTGEVIDTAELGPSYWYRNLRQTVLLEPVLRSLLEAGRRAFIEIGPHPVVGFGAQETIEDALQDPEEAVLLSTLRREEGGAERFALSLAQAHAQGVAVDWEAFFKGAKAKRVPLPTYPFQRERYWLASSAGTDASAIGQSAADHPLLGAAIEDPTGEGLTLTGRISLATHPWLADHALAGTVLLPATAFLELALRAGEQAGAPSVDELTLQAPLVLGEAEAVAVQVLVSGPGEDGRREISIHSRAEGGEAEWTQNAAGALSEQPPPTPDPLDSWPPEGAEPIEVEYLYDALAEAGLEYGPAFQGLTAAWRDGEEVYAEVSLPEDQAREAERFGIHPALLDAALHGIGLAREGSGAGVELPFAWSGVSLRAAGAKALRARIAPGADGSVSLVLADGAGTPLAAIGSLALRPLDPGQLRAPSQGAKGLLGLEWTEVALAEQDAAPSKVELLRCEIEDGVGDADSARKAAQGALEAVQRWLADESKAESRLALITEGAMATSESESPAPAAAAIWGLIRSAQSEHPGRFALIDVDGSEASSEALPAALAIGTEEPQLALREGAALAPRAMPARDTEDSLIPPPGPWHLDALERGTLESLALVPSAQEPLGPSEVRIQMRAAGLNFRDVLVALGLYPGRAAIGGEGAGVVVEVGAEVGDLAPGDRVMGLMPEAFGPLATSERDLLVPVPHGWSFEQAAAMPIVFATAYYGLFDLAGLKAGEKVLVHAGAGGVGMAAIGLAEHLGAEVFATASPAKWEALREAGLDEDHIASSRDLGFRDKSREVTGGAGVDVVLNALAGEFVDASLDLLPRGGRFLEMGKTDMRDPEQVAADRPGVSYLPFDVTEAGSKRSGEILVTVAELFEQGALRHSPIATWDMRNAPQAFRHLREGRNVGKVVLGVPRAIDPERTVLITGATGGLGALVARHLVERHGARHLLLVSRSGPEADGAERLREELERLGAEATIAACDVSDREGLKKLLASIPSEHPLGAVIHAAGAIADGTVESLSPERIDRVFAPKAEGAWNLHELTQGMDLSAFVLFSSAAGTLGGPGQANYAAANVYLDALAQKRRGEGRPATSIAWVLWERESGMTSRLGEADLARMRRGGIEALSDERGLALLDAALDADRPQALAVPTDTAALRALASAGTLPPILSGLVRAPRRRRADSGSLAAQLATLPEAEHGSFVLDLVRGEVAAVLGHSSAQEIEPERAFKEMGFDSLAAVELRNRLNSATGLGLGATTVFDYPTPRRLAEQMLAEAGASDAAKRVAVRAQASEEPIAIVGMACRYPGRVGSPGDLWRLVAEGRDGISGFPDDRGWDLDRLYDPDPDRPGASYTREGGFVFDAAEFDAEFFGISPREALAMDPQQRLLLESSWEALEDAGIDPAALRGEPAGVFTGLIHQGYAAGSGASASGVEGYQATGNTASIASGRIAYALGLEGPAMTVDTACSSSLVAIHLASQALRQGECTLALAGGVTAFATPGLFVEFSRQRGLAPDGRSKSFAEAADGAGFAEGVGMLLLERLSNAQRNGHRIVATIRGSAVNQDGASNGLTAPNGPSQERVIRQALANARLEAKDVHAVEAHGTGTTLGDPIEAGALLATYGQDREQPLKLGSIKSNIGHTQAAAGVAGVIKMALAMREGVLPKTLHVDAPSSKVDWEAGEIELLTEQVEWEGNGHPRRAGVSSFGISGTNAHVILEEAPRVEPAAAGASGEGGGEVSGSQPLSGQIPLSLSAKAEPALVDSAARLAAHLQQSPDLDPTDVAYSLATTRSAFEHRAVVLGADREELLASLASLANADPSPNVLSARAKDGKLAYLFTGQGSQRLGMGRELYESDPHFRAAFDAACAQLDQHLEAPLKEIVFAKGKKAAAKLEDTAHTQPALFAIEVALFEALAKRGLRPDLLAGHSIGEIAAAHLAGVLDLPDAAKLVAARGKLMSALPAGGAMAAIEATEEEVAESIAGKEQELSIAAINGPSSTVISGSEESVEEIRTQWEERGRKTKRLAVSHAFHSPLIEPMLEEFAEVAEGLSYREPKIPIVSNVSGEALSPEQATDPAYWVHHVRQPVRFADAVNALKEQGASTYVELGPDPVLCAMARETLGEEGDQAALVPTLRESRPEADAISTAIAAAHAAGAKLDWAAFFAATGAKRVPLPTYPFQHKRYWLDSAGGAGDLGAAGLSDPEHPLLGAAIETPGSGGLTLSGRLSLATHPWLADHAIGDTVLLPGTAFLELALRAAEQVGAEGVEELTMQAPLILPEPGAVAIQVSVSGPDEDGRREVAIHSRPEGESEDWTQNASGALSEQSTPALESLDAWPPEGAEPIEVAYLYDLFAEHGLQYGPAFQGLSAAWRDDERIYAEVSLPEEQAQEAERFGIHPALLDSALHGVALATTGGAGELKLPFSWSGVFLRAEGARELRVGISLGDGDEVALALADGEGAPLATVGSLALRSLDPGQLRAPSRGTRGLLGLEWAEVALAETGAAPAEVETLHCETEADAPSAEAARNAAQGALEALQRWLADESKAESRLALITCGAMAARAGESPDPAAAAIWGLVRSAQSEHPGRFALIDSDGSEASEEALPAALNICTEEPQLALREGAALAPRAMPAKDTEDSLIPPPGPWHLDALERGTLESLALTPSIRVAEPLGPTEVRIQMRAAGLNFRDVLIALGVYPGEAALGSEGAGVVVEVGAEVGDLDHGDRVMGLVPEAFGPLATSERDLLAPTPAGWSFEQAAAMPIAFATAYYGLCDLAGLKAGEKVLIHAGAGGVGSAAIQIARQLGAEVFATASPSKWEVLREAGLDESHIASSRDLEFKEKFLTATGGEGVDVVLNALAGEFIDASLDLLPRGGRFLEMGKADLRDPEQVGAAHTGVSYRPFDLFEAGPERTREILAEIVALFEQGVLRHSPIVAWDMRKAPAAFRHLREGRNVGKLVLGIPRPIDPERTVLITGATGALGALVARHLVERHDARHLLLVSRSGSEADGAEELQAELEQLGAEATIAACDVSDRGTLGELLASIPSEHPLGAVVHCAGALADGTIESQGEEQIERAFAPKAEGAWNLHELTAGMDLSAFVLFSSVAGTLGGPGQANYAAANVFLDALAQKRQGEGLAGTSIAWGLWEREGGMGGELGEADLARMRRGGIEALSDEQGLALFDAAIGADRPQALAVPIDTAGLRGLASAGALPPILSGLVRTPRRRSAASGSLATKLAALPEGERESFVLDLVRGEVAAVLAHASAQEVEPERAFQEMGFDSLAAVELRNRLNSATGLGLGATTVFDYPTPQRLAERLLSEATASGAGKRVAVRAQASEEPIAIVGMACRYPGGVSSPGELWQLVAEGRDGISGFPTDRGWDIERLYHPDPDHPGTSYTREGGFLAAAGEFDAEFFGISPREALVMDPQERLLLESCWEALEDAGLDPASLQETQTGVFAGVMYQDYGPASGMTSSIVSGRVAYTLGLEGPAITVDTACSSSLVAMHLASQALRGGECTLALAGGVTTLASPNVFAEFSRQRGLAPDGRSKSFADAADGVAWAEGVGVLVLERLSEAERNGHPIVATIRGSAVNQDGASNGLTAPNGPSQERVIRQALANARLEPKDVDAVEAHGTGTTLGDPIEAGALLATYGQEREQPLKLGSIKSNIGHAQAAAGVAGVIKMALAMREGVLPKTLHVDTPSSKVDWEAGDVELLTEQLPWEADGRPRRAGISSFGISGTNAHVILEEAPEVEPVAVGAGGKDEGDVSGSQSLVGAIPLALSVKAEPALAAAAERLATHLTDNPDLDPTDVAYSLVATRSAFEHRAVVLGENREELLASLASLANGDPSPNVLSARAKDGKLAYLFTGQGSQRLGMGRELYESDPHFRAAFDAACAQLDQHLEAPLKEIVFAKGKKAAKLLEDTAHAQPALFAIEVALFEALAKRGLRPDLLAGHSIGEIAAAHVAGVLDLADAAKLVVARGELMSALPAGGAMAAIEATEEEVAESIAGKEQELAIAAINGPSSTVISGSEESVEEIRTQWEERGRKTKRLAVSHAFHSPLIEPMLEEFAEVAEGLSYREPKIPIVSNVTGEALSPEQATDPAYWVAHVRQPVRFADAVVTLAQQGASAYLELGPDPVLCAMARETLGEDDVAAFVPTLRESRPEAYAIATAIASAHVAGAKLDWAAFFAGTGAKRVSLPTYPFQRERYWLSSPGGPGDAGAIGQSDPEHPLLAAAIEDPDGEGLTLTGRLSLATHPWLADHAIGGAVLLPGTAFLELALRAAEGVEAQSVDELTLQAPLVLPEDGAAVIQVLVSGLEEDGRRRIAIHSRPEGEKAEWALNASGSLSERDAGPYEPLDAWPPEGAEPIEVGDLYDRLAEYGLEYGPAFQGLGAAWRDGERIHAEVSLPEEQAQEAERFGIHPALLDSALHGIGLAATEGEGGLRLPFSWSGVSLLAEGARELRVTIVPGAKDEVSLAIADGAGAPLALVASLALRSIDPSQLASAKPRQEGLLGLELGWGPACRAGRRAPRGRASALRDRGRHRRRRSRPQGNPGRSGGGAGLARRRVEGRVAPGADHPGRDGHQGARVARPRRRRDLGPRPLGPVRAPRPLRPDRQRRQRGFRGCPPRRAGADSRRAPARIARGSGAGAAGDAGKGHRGLADPPAWPVASRRLGARHPGKPRADPEHSRRRAPGPDRGADPDARRRAQLPRRADRPGRLPGQGADRQRGRWRGGGGRRWGRRSLARGQGDGDDPRGLRPARDQRARDARPDPGELELRAGGGAAGRLRHRLLRPARSRRAEGG